MDTYTLIIVFSATIIGSYFFNIISKATKIPSVLLLMSAGIAVQGALHEGEINTLESILPVLGNIGLIMIVLEAALDLELSTGKIGLIVRSLSVALLGLVITVFAGVAIIYYGFKEFYHTEPSFMQCLAYSIPLSIMSSAIVIPSVISLRRDKREFMIYESTFSDILGIMFFYFLMGNAESESAQNVFLNIAGNIILTLILAAIVSYGLVYMFQRIKSQVKLFLIISVLMLMYALGKKLHLSSLVIILSFGLVLNNPGIFFRGRLSNFVNTRTVAPIMRDFHVITLETSFVIRTFFFIIFGVTISLTSLINWKVAAIAGALLFSMYLIRYILMRIILKKRFKTQLFLAPRGLITILLYFSILSEHPEFIIPEFDPGILLYVIILTSIIMAIALITDRGEKVTEVIFSNIKENIQDLRDLPRSMLHEMQREEEKKEDEPEDKPEEEKEPEEK